MGILSNILNRLRRRPEPAPLPPRPTPIPVPVPTPTPEPTPPTPSPSLVDGDQVIELVNAERLRRGIRALSKDDSLTTMAQDWANYMKKSGVMSHDGFVTRLRHFTSFGNAAENVGVGQATPEEIFTSWMNSAGHRTNMLNAQYDKVGVARNANWWAMDLGTSP